MTIFWALMFFIGLTWSIRGLLLDQTKLFTAQVSSISFEQLGLGWRRNFVVHQFVGILLQIVPMFVHPPTSKTSGDMVLRI